MMMMMMMMMMTCYLFWSNCFQTLCGSLCRNVNFLLHLIIYSLCVLHLTNVIILYYFTLCTYAAAFDLARGSSFRTRLSLV